MCFSISVMRPVLPAICALWSVAQLGAATLSRLSLDDMITQSTAIVHVRVLGSSAASRGSTIYTYYQIQTLDTWKGQPPASFAVPGGVANGFQQNFDGTPQLTQGKEYILFLWTSPSGLTQIIGLTQGLFEVSTDANGTMTALRSASTNTLLDPVTGRAVKDQPLQIQIGALAAQISSTLAKGKTN